MIEELESIDNPYGRLAMLIDDYLRRLEKPNDSQILQELAHYRALECSSRREEQVRSYCELACMPFPTVLVAHFANSYLYATVLRYMDREDKQIREGLSRGDWVAFVCEWLGFARPLRTEKGLRARVRQLQDSLTRLTSGRSSRQEIKGCGSDAHDVAVEILKALMSFYGRYLWGDDASYLEALIQAIHLGKGKSRTLRQWRDPDRDYRPDLGDLLPIFEQWNTALVEYAQSEWAERFQADFDRQTLLPAEYIDLLKSVKFGRREFAHPLPPEEIDVKQYKQLAQSDLESVLAFATRLEQESILPEVIIMQRRMILEGGEIRVDYLDEQHYLRHVRFRHGPIPFYVRTPVYYYQPESKGEIEAAVLDQPPIFIPVDEHWSGEVL